MLYDELLCRHLMSGTRWRDVGCGIVAPSGGASESVVAVYEVEDIEKSGGGEGGNACLEYE